MEVKFKNSKGDNLSGVLSDPSGDASAPILIMAHGFTSHKGSRKYVELEQKLNAIDVATLRFDFYGHGQSDGKFEDITVSEAVDDILQAIAFVKQQGFTDIHLQGNSFGGAAAILAASGNKDIKSLLLIAPVSDYETRDGLAKDPQMMADWKQNGYTYHLSGDGRKLRVNYTLVEDYRQYNGFEAAKKITVPTLIIHGNQDKSVPLELSERLVKIIANAELKIVDGSDHKFSNENHYQILIETIVEFIKQQTKF